jgi:hypothetical protein
MSPKTKLLETDGPLVELFFIICRQDCISSKRPQTQSGSVLQGVRHILDAAAVGVPESTAGTAVGEAGDEVVD